MGERGLGVGAPRCPCLLCCGRGEGTLHDPARTKYPCVHFLSLLIFLPHPSSQKRKLRPRGVLSFAQSHSDGQHQKQIDYILCSQRCRSSIQSAKTRLGDDCGSDHELLIATFRLKLKKVGKTSRPFRYIPRRIAGSYGNSVLRGFFCTIASLFFTAAPFYIPTSDACPRTF